MTKVKLDILKPWITQKITQLLGMEDDVVVAFVYNQLEAEKVSTIFEFDLAKKVPVCKEIGKGDLGLMQVVTSVPL